MSKKKLTVTSHIYTSDDQKHIRSKMALELLKSSAHCFSTSEYNLIAGRLRRDDLSVCQHELISSRLDEARSTGNMTAKDFAVLYQLYSLTRKAPESGDDTKCRQAGLNKLLKGEEKCLVTNMTMDARVKACNPLFDRVKRIIEEILGPVPSNFLTSPTTEIFFGPGSTVNLNERSYEQTSAFYKLTDRLIVPEKAKYYLAALISNHPNWVNMLATHYHTQRNSDESYMSYELRVISKHLEIVPNDYPSRIGFVPKDSDEHRAIGIEMNGLVPLQKTVGDLIRDRLCRRAGINLNSQERNRHLAKLAKTFGLATIDLANASSSISKDLVRTLLPYDWFILVDTFRSETGFEPRSKTTVNYEMISSMGNGFTFELESLIFYALAKASCEDVGLHYKEIQKCVSVFGDDIIIPADCTDVFLSNLTLFGFTANVKKSFTKGYFFESCGADYYDGIDVRPFFLKRDIITLQDMYFVLNSLLFKISEHGHTHLFGLYRALFKQIATIAELGPLHFKTGVYQRLSSDDLEAVLRVPLSFAQANGGVKFNLHLQAWVYKKLVRIALEAPQSKAKYCYATQHCKYMTFLRGQLEGKVLLRGRTRVIAKTDTTSSWDGIIDVKNLRLIKHLFDSLAF